MTMRCVHCGDPIRPTRPGRYGGWDGTYRHVHGEVRGHNAEPRPEAEEPREVEEARYEAHREYNLAHSDDTDDEGGEPPFDTSSDFVDELEAGYDRVGNYPLDAGTLP